jgi:hypothetical protein
VDGPPAETLFPLKRIILLHEELQVGRRIEAILTAAAAPVGVTHSINRSAPIVALKFVV